MRSIVAVPGGIPSDLTSRQRLLSGLRECLAGLAAAPDLAHLLDAVLEGLERHCDIRHAMMLLADSGRDCLYTVASRGYRESGVGSEVRMGEGIIGVAARERTPIRIGYSSNPYSSRARSDESTPSAMSSRIAAGSRSAGGP